MKKLITTLLPAGLLLALAVVTLAPTAAEAFPPRSPQVTFQSTFLQNYLNGLGESINVTTDQLDAQVWQASVSGNGTFTLMIELTGYTFLDNIGVYNTTDGPTPALFQLFPGAATDGWYCTAHFGGGNLSVALFDDNGVFQGSTNYVGVNANAFGFYLQGPSGTFYSEDTRNGGNPQVLTYAGTGQNYGDWWECFTDTPYKPNFSGFYSAVLLLQSVVPTPASTPSWGSLKSTYR